MNVFWQPQKSGRAEFEQEIGMLFAAEKFTRKKLAGIAEETDLRNLLGKSAS
ncbi:MAG: hypothetical protein ACR2G4_12040 [Pyrinomonadaceae bacterium]